MDVRNCKNCGKLFQYVGNDEVVEALNADHGVVYETLRTNNIILVLRP